MNLIPAPIQQLIDQGYGYIDMDGGVVFHEWCREACITALKKLSNKLTPSPLFQINVQGNMFVNTYIENSY